MYIFNETSCSNFQPHYFGTTFIIPAKKIKKRASPIGQKEEEFNPLIVLSNLISKDLSSFNRIGMINLIAYSFFIQSFLLLLKFSKVSQCQMIRLKFIYLGATIKSI